MKILVLLTILFSSNAFAQVCSSAKDCDQLPRVRQDCFLIDDGFDSNGHKTCHKQCFLFQEKQLCAVLSPHDTVGFCASQKANQADFNPNQYPTDCSEAVPYPDLSIQK